MPFLLIEMPGGGEMLIILVVVLLMFGGKKIPELMRGLGRGIREFNDAKSNVTRELEEGLKVPDHATTGSTPVNMPDDTIKPPLANNETASHTTPSAN